MEVLDSNITILNASLSAAVEGCILLFSIGIVMSTSVISNFI